MITSDPRRRTALPGPLHAAFARGELELDTFDHRAHLEVAYGYLLTDAFLPAAAAFTERLRAYLAEAGSLEKYHATLTLAFLALVHERLVLRGDGGGFEGFLGENPDLQDRELPRRRWGATLDHPLARLVPLVPGAGELPVHGAAGPARERPADAERVASGGRG